MTEMTESRQEAEVMISKDLTTFAEIIGFAAFSCGVLLHIIRASAVTTAIGIPQSLALVLTVAVALLAASFLNDWLITNKGRALLMICSLIGCCIGPLGLLVSGADLPFLLIASVGIAASVLIWGHYLSEQTHFLLFLITAVAFISAGIVAVLVMHLNSIIAVAATVFFLLLAWACAFLTQGIHAGDTAISRSLSIARNDRGRKNRFTLFTHGALFGIATYVLSRVSAPMDASGLLFGVSIVAAGVLMLIIRRLSQSSIEDTLLQLLTTITAAVLLPIPFLPTKLQMAFACFFMFLMTVHLIVVINAIAETIRFNMISSIWLFGIEAFFTVLGAGVGGLVFWWGFGVNGDPVQDAALCAGTVIVCGFMQVFIQMQSYPIVKELDNGFVVHQDFDDERGPSSESRAFWRTRLNVIADHYDLSPRQREVMELLIKGRDTHYIMEHFVISQATVKTHVYNLYKKLAVHSRQELLDLIEKANG